MSELPDIPGSFIGKFSRLVRIEVTANAFFSLTAQARGSWAYDLERITGLAQGDASFTSPGMGRV
jgi:hypothetical protein